MTITSKEFLLRIAGELRPIPDYLQDCLEFEASSPEAFRRVYLLAKWGEEYWLLFWNTNQRCWTSLRYPTETDLNLIERLDSQGKVTHRR